MSLAKEVTTPTLSSRTSLTKTKPAGLDPMVEASENQSPLVLLALKKMELFAILFVRTDIMVSVLFAGKAALLDLLIPALIASSLLLMEEELVMLSGMKVSATTIILKAAKNTALFTIPSVKTVSTMLAAVFVLPTVLLDGPISESPAKREAMEEALVLLLFALLINKKMPDCVILTAIMDTRELDLSAGLNVLLE